MEISEVIVYFLKVMLIQGVFFAFYWLVLKNRTHHGLNRVYLLGTMLVALVIPFIENPFPQEVEPILDVTMMEWMAEPIGLQENVPHEEVKPTAFPVWQIVVWLYLALIGFFQARSSFHLIVLQKIKKQCEYVKKHWFKLFKTPHSKPFSFFSNVFIPKEIFGTNSFDQILAHECVHVRQLHSLDRLLVDFLVSLFWFNPFIYLYRKALIEVHEFQADAAVIKQYDDLVGYQEILFAQLQPATYSGLVSHFNFSTIKKRIVMMNKSKNTGRSKLAYALTVPVVAMVLFAFTTKESEESVAQLTDKIEELTAPFNGSLVEEARPTQSDDFKPSILPLKTDAKFRLSSSFGMRKNPITSKRQHHKGVDLAAPLGTEVIATADGIVEELSSQPSGYGHMITLNHGDKYTTRYSQLSEFKVENGDRVKKGQVIGLVGSSGQSTGPHLHYEVYEGKTLVNPMDYIKNYTFASVSKPSKTKVAKKESIAEEPEVEVEAEVAMNVEVEPQLEVRLAELEAEARVQEERAIEQREMAEMQREQAEALREAAEKLEKRAIEEQKRATKEVLEDRPNPPIFFVNGEKVERSELSEIWPEMIVKIEVVKGENAIERYGKMAKNGVVLVTTKE